MTTAAELLRDYGYFNPESSQQMLMDICLRAAKQYLLDADLAEPCEGESDPMYDLACMMLATHWYDNRGVMIAGNGTAMLIPKGIDALIAQHPKTRKPEE